MFGLFKSKTPEVVAAAETATTAPFKNTTITTQHLMIDLEELAKKHAISPKKLDYKILSYKTLCKLSYGEVFKEVSELNHKEMLSKNNFLNPAMELYQELKVEVFLKSKSSKFPILMDVGGNKAFTNIKVRVRVQNDLQYFEGLEGEILAELDRKKARHGVLLGCMDEQVKSGVNKIVSAIRVNGAIKEEISFDICQGYDVIQNGGEEVIYHYKELSHVGLEATSQMQGVKTGDVVFEVLKQVKARSGRDCKGKVIDIDAVELSTEAVSIKVSEDFDVQESENNVLYIAKVDGFVYEEKDHEFEIRDEYVVDALSLKSTGSINVGQDKNIKITVKEHDGVSDAVGAGMKIDTSELKVAGNVANGAEIIATKVEIEGQTHQSAKITAKDVKIHIHKGYAEGDVVEIDTLEGGKVVGDIVRINQLFGGEIEAKEVYIQKVLSNAKVSASHHIEMEVVEGTGNTFIIDARVQRGYHEKNDSYIQELSDLEKEIGKYAKDVKRHRTKIQQEQENVTDISHKVKELKESGIKPPSGLILKLKEHQERIKIHNSLLKELKDAKIQQTSLQEALSELNSSVYEAKVINKSAWKEFNEVLYKLQDPPIEVSFLAKEGDIMETLTLNSDEDGEFQVKRQG